VALVLFGNSDTVLPGGYAGEEISENSPINQVTEFPQELVLLGRATVMIRGIANRLGVTWGLCDRWAAEAKEALEASVHPAQSLPIWSVALPQIATTDSLSPRLAAGKESINFKDIVTSFSSSTKLFQVRYVYMYVTFDICIHLCIYTCIYIFLDVHISILFTRKNPFFVSV
jgi:aarF domain-containing kinase